MKAFAALIALVVTLLSPAVLAAPAGAGTAATGVGSTTLATAAGTADDSTLSRPGATARAPPRGHGGDLQRGRALLPAARRRLAAVLGPQLLRPARGRQEGHPDADPAAGHPGQALAARVRRRRHDLRHQEEPAALLLGRQPPRPGRQRHHQAAHAADRGRQVQALDLGQRRLVQHLRHHRSRPSSTAGATTRPDRSATAARPSCAPSRRWSRRARTGRRSPSAAGSSAPPRRAARSSAGAATSSASSATAATPGRPSRPASVAAGSRSPPRGRTPAPATPTAASTAGAATPSARWATAA